MEPLLYLLLAAILAYMPLFLFDRWSKKRRLQAFHEAAERLEGRFDPAGDDRLLARLAEFELLARGKDGHNRNVISGDNVWLFEYIYRVSGRARHNRRYQTVVYIQRPGQLWPEFKLAPAGLIAAVRSDFGLRGSEFAPAIELPDQPDFNKIYTLSGPHADLIRPLFSDALVASFLDNPGATLEGVGDKLLFYYDQKRLEPHEVEAFHEECLARAELLLVDIDSLT